MFWIFLNVFFMLYFMAVGVSYIADIFSGQIFSVDYYFKAQSDAALGLTALGLFCLIELIFNIKAKINEQKRDV